MSKNNQDNELPKKFWEEVATKIELDYQHGPPKNWTKAERENFIKTFLPEIIKKKPHNYSVENPGISEATFRRIFISKESQGTNTTRDIFSWYLGYSNFFEYKAKVTNTQEKRKLVYPFVLAALVLGLSCLAFFLLTPEKNITSKIEKELIELVKEGNKFEFSLATNLQNFENQLDSLDIYFMKDEPARKAVINYLQSNKANKYVLLSPNKMSRQETLDARVTLLDTVNLIAHIETTEYWHYRWADTETEKLCYIYEKTNKQDYILNKNSAGEWRIKENLYRSDTEENITFCEINKMQDAVQNRCKENTDLVENLVEQNAIGQAILLSKCICEKNEKAELTDDFAELGRAYNLLKMRLNRKKINLDTFLEKQEAIKKSIYKKLESNNLHCS